MIIKNIINKEQENLKKVFKIEELKPYFYGYLSEDKPEKKVNDCLTTKEQMVDLAKRPIKVWAMI